MVEKDSGYIEPYLLTAEYWDGHAPDDECGPYVRDYSKTPTFRQVIKGERISRSILSDFLTVTNRVPVRIFNKGEAFLLDQFPEGTIIDVEQELLRLSASSFSSETAHFQNESRYGVLFGYDTDAGRQTDIMFFNKKGIQRNQERSASPLLGVNGVSFKIAATIGEVLHHKHSQDQEDFLRRVNKLTVYQMGKGAPQEARGRFALPRRGLILRPQRGNA